MPPTKRKLDSPTPFIAGADNPTLNSKASFPAGTHDPFADLMEYSTGSPDTLQHLAATNTTKHSPNFTNTQQLDLSEGGYHEMSDDSAGSSKRSAKRNESMSTHMSPEDTPMTANGADDNNENPTKTEDNFDMNSMIDFSNCIDAEQSPSSGNEQPEHFSNNLNMGMFGATSSGFGFGKHQQGGNMGNVDPSDTFNGFATSHQSPSMPTLTADTGAPATQHNRHHSIQSTDSINTNTWHNASERMSPMAMSHTQSPVPMPNTQPQGMDHTSQGIPAAMSLPQIPSPEAMHMMSHGRMANNVRQDPPKHAPLPGNYFLYLPDDPSKSRVETQTQLNMILRPPPPGITKLHLPAETVSKPKLMDKPKAPLSPSTLEMTVSVVCTSAIQHEPLRKKAFEKAIQKKPGELPLENTANNASQKGAEVRICSGCMTRERKRAARKRVKNQADEEAWLKNENFRIIVFNTNETKQWERVKEAEGPPGLKITLPLRIACYCRHHGEKSGFNIIFTLKDYLGNVVAQNMTNHIMVTDDHKTSIGTIPALPNIPAAPSFPPTLLPASPGSQHMGGAIIAPAKPNFAQTPPATDGPSPKGNGARRAPRAIKPGSNATSRAASPSQIGPSAKKRKSSKGAPPRVPQSLSMTKVEGPRQSSELSRASSMDLAVSPHDASENMFGYSMSPQAQQQNPFPNGYIPPTGDSPSTQFYSNPPSGNPSRAPSPQLSQAVVPAFSPVSPGRAPGDDLGPQNGNQGFRQGGQMYQMGQHAMSLGGFMPQGMDGIMQSQPNGMAQPTLDLATAVNDRRPKLSKVVPQEGSMSGGFEVTVLGKNLGNGMNIWFGEQKAHYTTFWSTDTVICLVPGANSAGVVSVTVEAPVTADNIQQWNHDTTTTFRYVDDTEDRLMKLALRLIGSKMNGKDTDVNNVARQVLQTQLQGGNQSLGNGGNMFNQAVPGASGEQLESQLLSCLDFIDNDDSPYEADLDVKDSSGQTMLHLAAVQGFRRLVAGLLVRGANPNELDNSCCTPLHMAAMHDKPEVVQRLMRAGANSKIQNRSELTAVDLSESGAVTRAIRHSLARSQSADFSHSRASSVSSLRSLCEPLSRASTNQEYEYDAGEESPEYTTGDFEDEDPDEDVYLHMRRPSTLVHTPVKQTYRDAPQEGVDDEGVQPIKTMADLKDQFQAQFNQLQQSWALHVQNHFPQMPQMPQMPALPAALPDYQAYFQQAPFMRRMTSYMPSMNGSRPESQDGESPKMDHRWWDLSSFMPVNQAPAPPPPYEEIFPQGDLDRKQASAAGAAAEAEADEKCANLYDRQEFEQQERLDSPTEGENSDKEPRIITIGRKNKITKEQQEQILRARDRKHTRLRNDRNLFVVWIPLLIIMVCAMAYRCFPSLPSVIMNIVVAAITIVRSFVVNVRSSGPTALGQQDVRNEQVVEL